MDTRSRVPRRSSASELRARCYPTEASWLLGVEQEALGAGASECIRSPTAAADRERRTGRPARGHPPASRLRGRRKPAAGAAGQNPGPTGQRGRVARRARLEALGAEQALDEAPGRAAVA